MPMGLPDEGHFSRVDNLKIAWKLHKLINLLSGTYVAPSCYPHYVMRLSNSIITAIKAVASSTIWTNPLQQKVQRFLISDGELCIRCG